MVLRAVSPRACQTEDKAALNLFPITHLFHFTITCGDLGVFFREVLFSELLVKRGKYCVLVQANGGPGGVVLACNPAPGRQRQVGEAGWKLICLHSDSYSVASQSYTARACL